MDKINRMFASFEPMVLSIFRIITGLLMFQFGVAKLLKFPDVPMFAKVTPLSLFGVAGMFELIVGGLLMLGLFSRLAEVLLARDRFGKKPLYYAATPRGLSTTITPSTAVAICKGSANPSNGGASSTTRSYSRVASSISSARPMPIKSDALRVDGPAGRMCSPCGSSITTTASSQESSFINTFESPIVLGT